ncbi:MAG: helix-turn-helix transcriptional regulator [Bacteriovorax sp.]|nr:helix-turn-helix transcriptional regulator [Bacteriovorax sp.]
MKLKKNLLKLMEEKNLSIAQIAKGSGVPKSNITKWMNGANPNLSQLAKVAEYFQLSVDEIAFDKKKDTEIENLFQKLEIHSGLYEVIIKKVSKK